MQTLFPKHYSIQLACAQDYRAFFDKELEFRQAMRYPPLVAMVNVVVRGKTFDEAMAGGRRPGRADRSAAPAGFVVLGPAPAPLTRLRGEHRAQFFLKGTQPRGDARGAARRARRRMPDARAARPRSTSIRCRCSSAAAALHDHALI